MLVYNFRTLPLTNADTLLSGPNPRRVKVIFSNAQNIAWVNWHGAAAARVGFFLPSEGSGTGTVEFGDGSLNSFVSQEMRGFLNVAGPNNLNWIEVIDE